MATVQFSSRPEEIHVGVEGAATGGREFDRPERLFSLQSQASTASSSGGKVKRELHPGVLPLAPCMYSKIYMYAM